MPAKKQTHRAKQIQIRDLVAKQEDDFEYPKPSWWREEIHGATGLAERKRLRAEGKINREKRGPRFGFRDWEAWKAQQP